MLQRSLGLLRRFKSALAEVKGEVTSAAIVFTTSDMPADAPAATVILSEDKPHEALAWLLGTKSPAHVLGVFFAARHASEKRFFAYPFDRTAEGLRKLDWAGQRQHSGKVRDSNN